MSGTVNGLKYLGFYIEATIEKLRNAKVLSMDSTFGISANGAELFAVLADFQGTRVPLADLFVVRNSQCQADPGRLSVLLINFIVGLKDRGLNPDFFGMDKDRIEIDAVGSVWESTSIQLCYWHVRRAVRAKPGDTTKTATSAYTPKDAQYDIPVHSLSNVP